MQLYALDDQNSYVNAAWAQVSRDYWCPECGERLRVRGGFRIQRHYYHFRGKTFCRQNSKSAVHLMVQHRILSGLPLGEGGMEVHFPEIGRIADVAWHPRKIVFEVQCAAMTPEEALARTADYRAMGWSVVWILHDKRYNKKEQSGLEQALQVIPHYFTNIDAVGKGEIYDQLVLWREGRQYAVAPAREVHFGVQVMEEVIDAPFTLLKRVRGWGLHLGDDYLSFWKEDAANEFWEQVKRAERREAAFERWQIAYRLAHRLFVHPYRLFLQWLLEGCCSRR